VSLFPFLSESAVFSPFLCRYDVHNLYGFSETIATRTALENIRGKRALVVARSTYSGQGHHGAHWLGMGGIDDHTFIHSEAIFGWRLFADMHIYVC
jgi:hypothetical protein